MEKSPTMLFLINFCIIFGIVVIRRCNATTYFVGDSSGWDISSDLESWTSVFQYSSTHSVYEVDKNNYQNCNSRDAIRAFTNGNTTVSLSQPGDRFFVCGNRLHCFAGMRLRVNVEGNGPSQAPVGSPQASAAGILQPSSKKNNLATGVASSAPRFNGSGSSGSMGIFVYLMVLAFPFIWTYL
ncbi:PREDICTED: mavicyanin-like isoform X2 [Camelina sativa]|uniref:Mavicyanin-like isoform X2 n=1 Tax=Camelina sativa TaxID=90675 RepID=A0ABM1QT17_CAMSA|nr:PREDICTED: mavicyanin-like isoform X2 [Camelina sativa]